MITKNGTWVVFLCSCIFRNALIRYLNIEKTSLNVRPKLYEMAHIYIYIDIYTFSLITTKIVSPGR